jgi:hypothetical protein
MGEPAVERREHEPAVGRAHRPKLIKEVQRDPIGRAPVPRFDGK